MTDRIAELLTKRTGIRHTYDPSAPVREAFIQGAYVGKPQQIPG